MHHPVPENHGRRTTRRWLSTLLTLVICLPARAQFDYRVEDGGVTIVRYTGDGGVVAIPSTLDGLPVRAIGGWSFLGRTTVTGVTIPDTVTRIETNAFQRCTGLPQLSIPAGVVTIDDGILAECIGLAGIVVNPNNPAYASQDGVLFNKTLEILKQFPGSVGGIYAVPEGVREIAPMAFTGCAALTGVTMPAGVTALGNRVFAGCAQLAEVQLNSGMTRIPADAFRSCVRLGSMTVPAGVTEIGALAFHDCIGLTNLVLPEGLTTLGLAAFSDCTALAEVSLPGSLEAPGMSVFARCLSLRTVRFGAGQTAIGREMFADCSALDAVEIPDSVLHIGDGAFGGCRALISVRLPAGLTAIEWGVFSGCVSLAQITLPDSIAQIGPAAFSGTALASVAIPSLVESIGSGAFAACPRLATITVSPLNTSYQSVDGVLFDRPLRTLIQFPAARQGSYTVPDGVVILGQESFSISALENLLLPASLSEIGALAFANSVNLTAITVPDAVAQIGFDAFAGATNLASAYFLGNAPNAERLFPTDPAPTVYYLPGTTGWGTSYGWAPTAHWVPVASNPQFSGGQFATSVDGPVSLVIVLESRPSLDASARWEPVVTNAIPESSRLTLTDTTSGESGIRLYRVQSP
ncbi:MAG: leucine-rich repeat domain-containing protein [Verrucomicrobia bacterium]|nr:leucine-rich repeat domain-containing protein [Verrucomicrobiota bacterium]